MWIFKKKLPDNNITCVSIAKTQGVNKSLKGTLDSKIRPFVNIFFKRRKYAKVEAATCSVRWNGTMLPITYFNIFCTTLLMQCTHYTGVLRSETMCCTCIVIYEYIIFLIFSFMFVFFTQKIMLHWPILNIAERLTANG